MWPLALSGVRAHRGAFAGTALVLALAGALVSVTGVLMESGLRLRSGDGAAGGPLSGEPLSGGLLVALASSFAGTALVVVMLVVASTVSLALRGRRRELALLRTVGATPGQVRRTVTLEVLVVTVVAAPVGAVVGLFGARLLDPLLVRAGAVGPGFEQTLTPLPVVASVLLVLATAVPAGRLAAREAARTAPTASLRRSDVETSEVGRGRRIGALVLAAVGFAAAFSSLAVPGTIGSASAATSAFLLIGAAALAGPVLVGWVFDRLGRLHGPGGSGRAAGGPATVLAVLNVRGFSRRLTTAVVPLALVVATATVQTSVDRAVSTAAVDQLRATVGADLVVSSEQGLPAGVVARVGAAPGVAAVGALADVPAQVRTDGDEELAWAEALVWESTTLRVVPDDVPATTFDPGVESGSLAGLDAPDTVAISTDAAFETGTGAGGVLTLRLGDDVVDTRVVAVYSRGLGVGDYLTGPATAAAHDLSAPPRTVLVDVAPGVAVHDVAAALRGLGVPVTDAAAYVAGAGRGGDGEQQLSTALLLMLLVVVAIGAATALALSTASRLDELRLLHRTGTTRRQLTAMTTVESLITGLTAWALGTLAVIPAVLGVSVGLLGGRPPAVDLATYAVASVGVVVLAVVSTAVASRRATALATASP